MRQLADRLKSLTLSEANCLLEEICGIVTFFEADEDKQRFADRYSDGDSLVCEDRVCYGDWQTPETLAEGVCRKFKNLFGSPDIIVEPTCGRGNFVLAALEIFPTAKEIHTIEINKTYTDELKIRILERFLYSGCRSNTKLYINTGNFFDFDLESLKTRFAGRKVAIIGNPPWVTNSRLGAEDSDNLPVKRNTDKRRGIEAITGKSNFDISESVTLRILELVAGENCGIALLLKNSVIRNLVIRQFSPGLGVSMFRQEEIDAKKEFGVSVSASCMFASVGLTNALCCQVMDFYSGHLRQTYGWCGTRFVADVDSYCSVESFDGVSPYEWRSGVKHDCSAVMELEEKGGMLINGLGEVVDIENLFVYPLLKSSDIGKYTDKIRKYVIITQRFVGEDTRLIAERAPLTYRYLVDHFSYFDKRKSSIYKGKKSFSIFGIGEYSFRPYKIVVSSLYRDVEFRMIEPVNGKPVMVDDTCYQIGFDSKEECAETFNLLNSKEVKSLINALVFRDSKRVVTRELLKRIDLDKIAAKYDTSYLVRYRKEYSAPVQGTLF